jgi:hypothetical protein
MCGEGGDGAEEIEGGLKGGRETIEEHNKSGSTEQNQWTVSWLNGCL